MDGAMSVATRAKPRARHIATIVSFLLLVVAPFLLAGWYLWARAADQYSSTLAFSVRQEESSSAVEILAGISALSGSSSTDTDVLYDYLGSQKLVEEVDAAVDLRAMWSRPGAQWQGDPIFALRPDSAIEDVVAHWHRFVRVEYGAGSGILEIRVLAFDPADAVHIAQAIYAAAQDTVNELSAIARDDALKYARLDLAEAENRLADARAEMTAFRNDNRIIDPSVDLEGQAGLLATLETELAQAMIELDLMRGNARFGEFRVAEAVRKVEVIEARVAAERAQLSEEGGALTASLVGKYERLSVELEFAQNSYVIARAAMDSARAEARRQTRYLAAHILPTRAETSRYPERGAMLALTGLFLLLGWAALVLTSYSLRDRN
ncbi:MAG: capsule biosynthesis protein [Pseudomonadota bacterium]